MAAPTKGVKLKMGGKLRTLRFDNAALVAIEDEVGLTLTELGAALQRGSLKTVATLLWAGRLHDEPDLTLSEVVAQVDLRAFEEVGKAIDAGLTAAFGEASDDEAPEGNPKATG